MIIRNNVHGTQKTVLPREFNVDTVYLRSNIHQIENKHGYKMWEYDVQEVSYEEYYKLIIPTLEDKLLELEETLNKLKEANN